MDNEESKIIRERYFQKKIPARFGNIPLYFN